MKYVDPTGMYNVETGEIEKGDTEDDIVGQVNETFGIETDWETISDVSFFDERFGTSNVEELVGAFSYVSVENTIDISQKLNDLNKERAQYAIDTD